MSSNQLYHHVILVITYLLISASRLWVHGIGSCSCLITGCHCNDVLLLAGSTTSMQLPQAQHHKPVLDWQHWLCVCRFCELQQGSGESPLAGDLIVVDYTARGASCGEQHSCCVLALLQETCLNCGHAPFMQPRHKVTPSAARACPIKQPLLQQQVMRD